MACVFQPGRSLANWGAALEVAKKNRRTGESPEKQASGLKPVMILQLLTARLKSCPDASCLPEGVFPQPLSSPFKAHLPAPRIFMRLPCAGSRIGGPPSTAATIIVGMKPHSIGRALGIGFRVAGRAAGRRISAGAQVPRPPVLTPEESRAVGRTAGQASRGLARGVGGFLRPFRRVGGILWLEVTGVFFFLPVLVFAPTLWRVRASWIHGANHKTFMVTAAVVVAFLYLGVSSFWRARKK